MKLHDIGLACRDIAETKALLRKTHAIIHDSGNVFDDEQDATVCLLQTEEKPYIELVSGKRVKDIVKRGISFYHLGYEVSNIDNAVKKLELAGGVVITGQKSARLFNLRKAVFIYLPYGLIELIEENR